jgi:hypothetical protein
MMAYDVIEEDERQIPGIPSWADRMMQDTQDECWRDRNGVAHRIASMSDEHLCNVWIIVSIRYNRIVSHWGGMLQSATKLMPPADADYQVELEDAFPVIRTFEATMNIVEATWKLIDSAIKSRGISDKLEAIIKAKRERQKPDAKQPFKIKSS